MLLIAISSKQNITSQFLSHCAPPTAPVCICFRISSDVCCEITSLPLRMFCAFVPAVYCCNGTNDIWSSDECENSISAGWQLFRTQSVRERGPDHIRHRSLQSAPSVLFRDNTWRRGLFKASEAWLAFMYCHEQMCSTSQSAVFSALSSQLYV